MKMKELQNKRGRPIKEIDRKSKIKKATQISSQSRVIAKIPSSTYISMKKVNKAKQKMRQYSLRKLTNYFESKFNVPVSSEVSLNAAKQRYRNKYLFPIIKENGRVLNRDDILFTEKEALDYLQTLSRTFDKSDEYYMDDVPYIEEDSKIIESKVYSNDKIMIKKSYNLSTTSDVESRNDDHKSHCEIEEERYIDQYELEYMNQLKNASKPKLNKNAIKWMGKMYDSFRLVENHKKSGIFYAPYIPSDIDSKRAEDQSKPDKDVIYPITLKTIGVQLSLGLYKTHEDFKYDMQHMFSNSRVYLKKKPKLLKDLEAIEKRFINF